MNTHIIVSTAGHIDHGKSALLTALTGRPTDRLQEEKARGITIQLGFLPWQLGDGLQVCFVDVPGHERLVRTMVAGVGDIDIALLAVAADDGVMPQTREHLDILGYLGVKRGIVALTKCDAVDPAWLELAEEDVREALAGTMFEDAPMLRTSARTGQGLEALKEALQKVGATVHERPAHGPACFAVDRRFQKTGFGPVLTGNVLRGRLNTGDDLEAWYRDTAPAATLKVRGMQVLGDASRQCGAGTRAALNVSLRAGDAVPPPGTMLTTSGSFRSTQAILAQVHVAPHATSLREETLMLHIGTTESITHVVPLGCRRLEAGGNGLVLLRPEQPLITFADQRFVLRRPGIHGQATIAGGGVLDPYAPEGKSAVSRSAVLAHQLASAPDAGERLLALARTARARGVLRRDLVARLPVAENVDALIEAREADGQLLAVHGAPEPCWVEAGFCRQLAKALHGAVVDFHRREPGALGLPRGDAAGLLPPPERPLVDTVITWACTHGLLSEVEHCLLDAESAQTKEVVLRRQAATLLACYETTPYAPPLDQALPEKTELSSAAIQHTLERLRRNGELVRIARGMHMTSKALNRLEASLRDFFDVQAVLKPHDFKTLAGDISRKWAIPILEYFDRRQITLRTPEGRTLHPNA